MACRGGKLSGVLWRKRRNIHCSGQGGGDVPQQGSNYKLRHHRLGIAVVARVETVDPVVENGDLGTAWDYVLFGLEAF